MRSVYSNYKTLMKDIEKDLNKWKHLYILDLEELIMLQYPYYPNKSTNSLLSGPPGIQYKNSRIQAQEVQFNPYYNSMAFSKN